MTYQRPEIPRTTFVDADGAVIPYGSRWDFAAGPPEDAYSVLAHPERFAPLKDVADALIGHLVATYDVTREDAESFPELEERGVQRAVRLTPTDPLAARLTFGFADHPGLRVRAGVLHEDLFPVCACDACDEDVEVLAGQLEDMVFDVVEGNFRERVSPGLDPRVAFQFQSVRGGRSGEGSPGPHVSRRDLVAARKRLRGLLDGRWAAWPAR